MENKPVTTNLRSIPKVRDSISYVYVERCRIEQDARAVAVLQEDGRYVIPCASLTTLMLGPGAVITHAAIKNLADGLCSVQWVGEDGLRFYASGSHPSSSVERLYHQAKLWADPAQHLGVVRRMYAFRFTEPLRDGLTLEQIRGLEGVRVRTVYNRLSKEMGVKWRGRDYKLKKWEHSDPVNRALSAANACLYSVCQSALNAVGYSTALGFIHIGKPLSFVYDVADLYKTEITIPAAFKAASEAHSNLESRTRQLCREKFAEHRLMQRIVDDVDAILGFRNTKDEADLVGSLWDDKKGSVEGGVSYGEELDEETSV
ncbi:MAG TPA: type I-E CRISPR-associated endonuclease Cas1 [Synechococcus sp. M44_DOE_062]|nr:type I-E CRISPR-associated endonuclease Cas1 [Synechococcus sp. M44_DOE_062]